MAQGPGQTGPGRKEHTSHVNAAKVRLSHILVSVIYYKMNILISTKRNAKLGHSFTILDCSNVITCITGMHRYMCVAVQCHSL